MRPIIRIENLGKQYRVGARRAPYGTLRESLTEAARRPLRWLRGDRVSADSTFWALKDVSFEVQPGEVVGIIGRNGAGKSTLLKILSRITEPTTGAVDLFGRVASLLEVGTGFHPELTGRENVYLNGAILGMKRREIDQKFDTIVEFAEVQKFIDTPVKHYSSGMYMRLAFAIAAHLEPEILVIDEVLAVGDAAFQKKCLGQMEHASKEGRTVLFVSHNMAAVENLCHRGILLRDGKLEFVGTQIAAIAEYLSNSLASTAQLIDRSDRGGTGEVRIIAIEFKDEAGKQVDIVRSGQHIDICFHFETRTQVELKHILVGFMVTTESNVPVFLQHNRLSQTDFGILPRRGSFVCRLNRLPLPASRYGLTYSVLPNYGKDGIYYDRVADAAYLTVIEGDFFGSGEVPGIGHGVCLADGAWRIDPARTASTMSD